MGLSKSRPFCGRQSAAPIARARKDDSALISIATTRGKWNKSMNSQVTKNAMLWPAFNWRSRPTMSAIRGRYRGDTFFLSGGALLFFSPLLSSLCNANDTSALVHSRLAGLLSPFTVWRSVRRTCEFLARQHCEVDLRTSNEALL